MKYVCLGYFDETRWESLKESERNAIMDRCIAYDDELRRTGHFTGGERHVARRSALPVGLTEEESAAAGVVAGQTGDSGSTSSSGAYSRLCASATAS